MKIKFAIYFLFFITVSCGILNVSQETKNSFTYCYDADYSGIDTLIRINGYYLFNVPKYQNNNPSSLLDSTIHNCMFFKNGIFVYDICLDCFQSEEAISKSDFYKGGGLWGLYTIVEDTIKAQFIGIPGSMSGQKGELWFEILNEQTIYQLFFDSKRKISATYSEKGQIINRNASRIKGRFYPLEILPNPERCWLIKKKWFWCNKDEYKRWKEGYR